MNFNTWPLHAPFSSSSKNRSESEHLPDKLEGFAKKRVEKLASPTDIACVVRHSKRCYILRKTKKRGEGTRNEHVKTALYKSKCLSWFPALHGELPPFFYVFALLLTSKIILILVPLSSLTRTGQTASDRTRKNLLIVCLYLSLSTKLFCTL